VIFVKNIILIGMPGCGKTTIGKILAKTLNKDFFDADDVFEKNTSFLELLSRFCDLKNATQDLMIGLNLDGELTVRLSDISTNSLNEENALKCQMTGLRGFVSTSLIEAVTNDIIYDITQLLRSISVKQVEKIEWEQWRKESK